MPSMPAQGIRSLRIRPAFEGLNGSCSSPILSLTFDKVVVHLHIQDLNFFSVFLQLELVSDDGVSIVSVVCNAKRHKKFELSQLVSEDAGLTDL